MHNTKFKKYEKCFPLPQHASGHTATGKTPISYIGQK